MRLDMVTASGLTLEEVNSDIDGSNECPLDTSLIAYSTARVEAGVAQVGQAGETMRQVVDSIACVTSIMGEISTASAEQSEGVGQVGGAVSSMDQATQQNAALVEQTAAAAESMRQQSSRLSEAVAAFRVDGAAPRLALAGAGLPSGPAGAQGILDLFSGGAAQPAMNVSH